MYAWPTPRRDACADAGFTLVEALVSLTVTGLISMMIISGVSTGRRAWEGIDTRELGGERLEAAQTTLRDRLEQAFPAPIADGAAFPAPPPRVDFAGLPRRMNFLASPPYWQRPAPLRRYSLELDAGGRLVLTDVSDVAPPETAPTTQVLITGVQSLDLAYFGEVGGGENGWVRQWADQPTLPRMVRVRVAFARGDPRRWPDLLVHPRATIDAACRLDLLSHRCKGRS